MLLTIIIPAFNVSDLISNALNSVFNGIDPDFAKNLDVIVVNDGSKDSDDLIEICKNFPDVRVFHHPQNRGTSAARNTAIAASQGDYVTLLDADDEFAPNWAPVFQAIVSEWPLLANVCFTPCLNDAGNLTCSNPSYKGWLTAGDMACERLSGEYNPIFRGDYIRRAGYDDLGTRKSCELLSYLRMTQEAPFWITDKVMRRYHEGGEQSVTHGWTRPDKAAETVVCFTNVLNRHGDFINSINPIQYKRMQHKLLIYKMLSGQGKGFADWWKTRTWNKWWLATLILLIIGRAGTARLLGMAKRYNLLRRYG